MGFEKRGNRLYLYRKERRGKRVVSIYLGNGEVAQLIAKLDRLEKEKASQERFVKKESLESEKRHFKEIDQFIDAFCDNAKRLEEAIFLINGYYKHSRTWRRKRDAKKSKSED